MNRRVRSVIVQFLDMLVVMNRKFYCLVVLIIVAAPSSCRDSYVESRFDDFYQRLIKGASFEGNITLLHVDGHSLYPLYFSKITFDDDFSLSQFEAVPLADVTRDSSKDWILGNVQKVCDCKNTDPENLRYFQFCLESGLFCKGVIF